MSIFWRRHSRLIGADSHSIVWTEVTDTTARLALSLTSHDDGKVVVQLDNSTVWLIGDYSGPTFIELTGGGGGGAVSSVFGRVGDVDADPTDYAASIIDNDSGVTGVFVDNALDTLDAGKSDTSHTHTLSDVSDAKTAAAEDVGVTVDDVVQLEDIGGGTAGLAAVDGSQLTGVPGGGSDIEIEDDINGVLTTAVTKFFFDGDGVSVTNPTGEEVTVTVAGGSAPVDTVFGRTGTVLPVADDYEASEVENIPAGDIAATDVQAAINELDTDKAATVHTHDYAQVVGVSEDSILGRDAAGTGPAESMSPSTVRTLLNVEDGSKAAGTSGDAYATSHDSDSTAHTAVEIVNAPNGDIEAVTVQAAIDELDTEKSATSHGHTLSDISDAKTAAAKDFGVTIGELVELENVGGNPGLPNVDGSQLTGVTATSDIEVVDETTSLTDTLVKMTFTGTGVTASEPGAEGEIVVNVTSGAPGVIDITDGTTTVSAADKLTVDSTAFDIIDEGNDDALLNPIFGTSSGQLAEGDHTHDTLVNVSENIILGRDTAGTGPSEELSPGEARCPQCRARG